MEYSYLNLGHLSSILKIERGSNPYPWSELNFKDCLEQGYYSLALEDQTELVGFAIMAISTEESHLLNIGVREDLRLSLIHISEPTRQAEISYAVFCLKKKN